MKSIVHEGDQGQVLVTSVSLDAKREDETLDQFCDRMTGDHVGGLHHFLIDTAELPNVSADRWIVDWKAGRIVGFENFQAPQVLAMNANPALIAMADVLAKMQAEREQDKAELEELRARTQQLEAVNQHVASTLKL